MSWLPQYHDMGLIGSYLGTLRCGGKGFYASPFAFVKRPACWLEAVDQFRGTHLQAPNFAYREAASKSSPRRRRSSFRTAGVVDGLSASQPRRRRDSSKAYPRRSRGAAAIRQRHIRVAAAAPPRFNQRRVLFRGATPTPIFCRYALVARKPPSSTLDLSCVRHAINAAEPVDVAVIDAFEALFCASHGLRKGVVFPTYGLAESTVLVCGNGASRCAVDADALRDDRVAAEAPGGAGFAGCGAPRGDRGVDVAIVDRGDDDDAVPVRVARDGAVGEIWVRSPSVAAGYWGRDDDADFGAVLEGTPGYLRTGDEGFLLRGELFVCGRRKDLIILRGKNHYPQDIEKCVERAASKTVRPGCVAAVAGGDGVVVVAEVTFDRAEILSIRPDAALYFKRMTQAVQRCARTSSNGARTAERRVVVRRFATTRPRARRALRRRRPTRPTTTRPRATRRSARGSSGSARESSSAPRRSVAAVDLRPFRRPLE